MPVPWPRSCLPRPVSPCERLHRFLGGGYSAAARAEEVLRQRCVLPIDLTIGYRDPLGIARLRPGSIGSPKSVQLAFVRLAAHPLVAHVHRRVGAACDQSVSYDPVLADANRRRIQKELERCSRADVNSNQTPGLGVGRQQRLLGLPGLVVEIVAKIGRLSAGGDQRQEDEYGQTARTPHARSFARASRT